MMRRIVSDYYLEKVLPDKVEREYVRELMNIINEGVENRGIGNFYFSVGFVQRTVTGSYLFKSSRYYNSLIEVDTKGNVWVGKQNGLYKVFFSHQAQTKIKEYVLANKEKLK